jgi:hypothetical protein
MTRTTDGRQWHARLRGTSGNFYTDSVWAVDEFQAAYKLKQRHRGADIVELW